MSEFESDIPSIDLGEPGGAHNIPFASIVETINDGILLLRLDSTIIYVNLSMATMVGYQPEEMVGRSLYDFMSEEWANIAKENLKRRRDGIAEMFDHQWVHQDGYLVWTLVSAKPMHDAQGVRWGSLVAIQDISERKQMEGKLRQARDELELRVMERTRQLSDTVARLNVEVQERREAEAEAVEASRAKSAFLANMSHELRTPLNAVIGYTELIQEDLSYGDEGLDSLDIAGIQDDLTKVHQAAKHLLALINDILDLSKVEAGKMDLHLESFGVGELVEEVLDTVRPLVDFDVIQMQARGDAGVELVADRTKLKQVLLNLTGNAVKFTERGQIILEFEDRYIDHERWVVIGVRDTGVGIAEENIDGLFEPFTQADGSTTRRYGGTGLGLAICKRFCEMMGGRVELHSRLNEGTSAQVFLPAEQSVGLSESTGASVWPDTPEPGALESQPSAYQSGPSVLVIDDDPTMHELMRRFLHPRGFRVYSAFHGDQGIEQARALQPDVITLDVMMPGRDGWSVLSSLKADPEVEQIPVVMVTMIDDKSIGYALGASDYLVKPIQRDRLVRVLSRYHSARGGQVLVVDDDPRITEVIQRHLERAGWAVKTAENGKVALDMLDDECPDVVLLDLMMPEMDGFEVAEIMRQEPRWQDIPIIVVTAMNLDDAEKHRLNQSVERILSKNVGSIEQVVDEVLSLTDARLHRQTK